MNADTITLEDARVAITQAIYHPATKLYESLEYTRKIHGNGHHMAQRLAGLADALLVERWNDRDEADKVSKDQFPGPLLKSGRDNLDALSRAVALCEHHLDRLACHQLHQAIAWAAFVTERITHDPLP